MRSKAAFTMFAAAGLLLVPGLSKAAEVYNCTESLASGVEWKDGEAAPNSFAGGSFSMEFLSNVEMLMDHPRRPSSKGLGKRESFECDKPYPEVMPDMLVCTDGAEMVVFDQKERAFSWGYLFSENVTTYGAPNAFVAIGKCSR